MYVNYTYKYIYAFIYLYTDVCIHAFICASMCVRFRVLNTKLHMYMYTCMY